MDLGKKRANFIIQTLVKLGVPSTLLQAESQGEHVLPSKRSSESLDLFRKRCRRVELIKEIK
jgi:outer membrane protein OmpA-like peptidoglycan-associated protein